MRNGHVWWFGSTLFFFGSEFQRLEDFIWQAFEGMFECSHVVPGWNDEGKEEAHRREEDIWRIEGPKMCPTYCQMNRHKCCWEIDIASQCNMFDRLLWLECRYIAKAVWLSMCSFHVNRLQSLELQEKVEALLRKNPPPSSEERQVHHVMSCHNMPQQAYQPYQSIRHSVEAMVRSQLEVCEPGRTSLEMTDSPPAPGDHEDLGGVEKEEGCQWRHGGLCGAKTYPIFHMQI